MKQCLVCFSSFLINKTLRWKCGQLLYQSREDTRHYLDIYFLVWYSIVLYVQGRHREAIMLPPVRRCPSISMRLLCSLYAASCLSISHLKLFASWQFIRFSSPRQGWAIIRPHQAWRGNHSWAFFSHGVFSQWQAYWLCVGSGRICLPSSSVELLWGTQIEMGGERVRVKHIRVIHL